MLVCAVNGAASSLPEASEEVSEWVTAIGGDEHAQTHTHAVVWVKVLPEWTVGLFLVCLCRGLCGFLAGREGDGTTRRGGGRVPELAAGGVEGAAGASV